MYTYALEFATSKEHPKRGVVFIISNDRKITAKAAFDEMNIKTERMFRTRFDAWRDGKINSQWYHGWNMSEFGGRYSQCFVFKCKEKHLQHRLYGFLCNPKSFDKGYFACILVCHAKKKEHETDIENLKDVETIRTSSAVGKAIDDFFREYEYGCPLDRTKH